MRIEASQIFTFYFPYEGHELTLPVRAQTREEACQKLLHFFSQWGMEVSMEAPKVASVATKIIDTVTPPSAPNSYVLELDIEQLVKDIMPIKKPKGANSVEKLVKEWTGFPYETQNYPAIIASLQKIKNGQE